MGIICFFVLPETSGMSLSEIQEIYKSKSRGNKAKDSPEELA